MREEIDFSEYDLAGTPLKAGVKGVKVLLENTYLRNNISLRIPKTIVVLDV